MSEPRKLRAAPELRRDQVIEVLERVLARARDGKIREIHIVTRNTDRSNTITGSGYDDRLSTLGALELLKYDLIRDHGGGT